MESTVSIAFTPAQIAFIRDSLNYTAKQFRDQSYAGQDPQWVAKHRRENEAMLDSICTALSAATSR